MPKLMGFLNREKVLNVGKIHKYSLDHSYLQSENESIIQTQKQAFIISPEIKGMSNTQKIITKPQTASASGGHTSLRASFKRPDMKETHKILQVRKPFIYEGRETPPKNNYENHQEHAEKSLMMLESSANDVGYDEKSGASYVWIESESISNNDVK